MAAWALTIVVVAVTRGRLGYRPEAEAVFGRNSRGAGPQVTTD
jgi:hypothetical protein